MSSSSAKKVLLAYSGGLDTTWCALYLSRELGYEVHTLTVDTGGFSPEELLTIESSAKELGVRTHKTLNICRRYYDDCIRYLLAANALKNQVYPLSVSAERVFQARAIAEYANEMGVDAVAHGSTGAGNDQVRFDMALNVLCPSMEIITPIRDLQLSREQEIDWLKKQGVQRDWAKSVYSINQGLWGTSVGGKETLTSHESLPDSAFPVPMSKTEADVCKVTIGFSQGNPVSINGQKYDHPVEAINALQTLAVPYGIGRDVHVGDTIIGIKGRVGFEAAAPVLLIKAHHLLEKHVLSRHQLNLKDGMAITYGNMVHEGLAFDPSMQDMEAFLASTQRTVSGEVDIELAPWRYSLLGIRSKHDLMSSEFGSYGEMNLGWSGEDVKGFTKIYANSSRIYTQINGSDQ